MKRHENSGSESRKRWGETPSSPNQNPEGVKETLMKHKPDRVRTPYTEPGRKNPSQGVHIYSGQPTVVFLTVRTLKQGRWLANETAHELLHRTWLDASGWRVGDYLLMTDHLHLFCAPGDMEIGIEDWIQYWKRGFKRLHGHADWKFQSRGWHHRLRSEEDYSEKWLYMMENPVRRGLVEKIEDWPYRGKVFEVER